MNGVSRPDAGLTTFGDRIAPSCGRPGGSDHLYSFQLANSQVFSASTLSESNLDPTGHFALAVFNANSNGTCGSEHTCVSEGALSTGLPPGSYVLALTTSTTSSETTPSKLTVALAAPPQPVLNGISNIVPSKVAKSWHYYSFVMSSSSNVVITSAADAGIGDIDVYVERNTLPTLLSDWKSTGSTLNEKVEIPSAVTGTYIIGLHAFSDSASVTLKVTW